MLGLRVGVAATVMVALAAGCATVREAGRHPGTGDLGAIHVAAFADDDARGAGHPFDGAVSGVLERQSGRQWIPIFRSIAPTWTVASLEPGRYRVRFDARLDPRGAPEALERPVGKIVKVHPGEVVDVELILDHVSPAMVAAGAAAVVVAAVLLHRWLDDHDLPHPPLPPPEVVNAAFWVTLDLANAPPDWRPVQDAPLVTSHFPLEGDLVAARRVRVLFSLSEPIDPSRLGSDAVSVSTAAGERLPGRVSWDPNRWWIVWEPATDLPPGTEITASLDPGQTIDDDGLPLTGPASFRFRTVP